jgi:hypothetical protein
MGQLFKANWQSCATPLRLSRKNCVPKYFLLCPLARDSDKISAQPQRAEKPYNFDDLNGAVTSLILKKYKTRFEHGLQMKSFCHLWKNEVIIC